ncbi:uncharacterized protein [Eleutherodactylus coqui]|uniref:uncharacterized protein n=1 Tax=Eleutherodactylus coqui TaxID=57060 RepID=UPI0034636397
MQEEKTSLMAEIRSVVREEVQSSLSDLQPGSGVTRRSVPAVSESDSDIAENVDFDGEVTQEDKKYLFSTADMDQLLKAVRRTMQVEEDVQQPRTVQEDMFAGLLPQQKSSFPVNATLKQLILNEWESVDQAPLIPREFKERLLFPGDEVSFLDEIPKVDTAIAMVSRKSGLPFEDTSHLKDPLDHKVDTSMRKAWSTSGLIMKANIAATSVARSMAIWLDQFAALVDQKAPREEFASGIPLLRMATGFLADASMETVRLGARMAALSNTARRAVWVKEWSGDAASKNRLCTLPFRGGRIFGPDLDRLLEKAADKSHGLPATRPPKRPFTPHPSSTYAGKGKTGRWSYPKGGRGKTLTFVPQPILSGPVGGRLARYSNSWRSITTNEWVLHLVAEGYRIELLSRPPDRFMITPTQSPGLEQALLEGIRNLQGLGAIIPVPKKEQGKGFYSPLFLVPKPDGSHRTIINLKQLNKFIEYRRFKMETIRTATPLIARDNVMATIDLKDAYFHIPIYANSQKFLRFALRVEGEIRHFQFVCLPFGISSAPRIFSKVVMEMVAFLRNQGVMIIPYLDDFLLVADSPSTLRSHLESTLQLFKELGWIVNESKSNMEPETRKKFLGVILDSSLQNSSLPPLRKHLIIEECSNLYKKHRVTIRDAMRILGLMTSCIGVVPWAQFHSRGLQSLILRNWDKLQASLDQTIPISAEARASLRWWVSSDNLSQASDWNLDPAVIITTDASAKGWGAHFEGGYVQGAWDVHEKASSSNFRELKAVWKSLRSLQTRLVAKHVRIFSDNMTTVSLIRHQGTTRNPPLQRLAGRILQWAEGTTKSLSAFHIRGAENSAADFLSRRKVDPGEWELHPEVFSLLVEKWGVPEVDLFASSANTKCRLFFSRGAEKQALGTDALSHPWDWDLAYAFPPLPLIPLLLRKLLQSTLTVIFVAPYWPKRPWFPLLRSLSVGEPFHLPTRPDLLSQGPLLYPEVHKFRLTAWSLSG